jgi:hypothetical protein
MGPFAFTLRIKNAQRAGEVTFRCDGVSRRSLIENRLVTRAAKVPAEETLAAMSTAAARHAGHMGSSLDAKQFYCKSLPVAEPSASACLRMRSSRLPQPLLTPWR